MLPRPPLLLALALCACGQSGDAAEADTGTGDATSEVSGTPTTGDSGGCRLGPADCPPPNLCEQVECVEQQCIYTPIAADQRDDDLPGDCRSHQCDGAGGSTPIDDATDVPDDAVACTDDLCTATGPQNVPREPGSACDDGYCHPDLSCQVCPNRTTCQDDSPAEPNETQSAARTLPQIGDADERDHACEALGDPGDVDWFRVTTVDLAIGKVKPAFVVEPPELQLCVYFQCKQGGTSVTCPEGAVADNAQLGQLGCCGRGSLAPQIDCKGFNEDATVWMMVGHDPGLGDVPPEPPACLNYQLGYEY